MTEKLPIEYQITNYSNIYLSFLQRSQKVNDSRMGEFLLLTINQKINQRINGPVNAYLRSATYTNKRSLDTMVFSFSEKVQVGNDQGKNQGWKN